VGRHDAVRAVQGETINRESADSSGVVQKDALVRVFARDTERYTLYQEFDTLNIEYEVTKFYDSPESRPGVGDATTLSHRAIFQARR
jgi:hypothetical protein